MSPYLLAATRRQSALPYSGSFLSDNPPFRLPILPDFLSLRLDQFWGGPQVRFRNRRVYDISMRVASLKDSLCINLPPIRHHSRPSGVSRTIRPTACISRRGFDENRTGKTSTQITGMEVWISFQSLGDSHDFFIVPPSLLTPPVEPDHGAVLVVEGFPLI